MHRFYHLNLNSYCSLEKSLFFPQSLGAVLNRQSCFPGDSDGEECACNAGDLGLIPGSGRSSGEGHGNPLRYSCLENPHGQRSLVLQSMGSQKVGHGWSDLALMHTYSSAASWTHCPVGVAWGNRVPTGLKWMTSDKLANFSKPVSNSLKLEWLYLPGRINSKQGI